ncbi:MAG: FkbM family methyltransferase [Pseudomonadota bacterium]
MDRAAATPPDPNDPENWAHGVRDVENAVIAPSEERGLVQPSGVFDADGQYCHDAILWRGKPLMTEPPMPDEAVIGETLKGRYLWCGVLHNHFGHFLVESIGRLWGVAAAGALDGILFTAKRGEEGGPGLRWHSEEKPALTAYQMKAFEQLGVDAKIGIVSDPLRVGTLCLPGQGFGMGTMAAGTPAYRQFVLDRFAKDVAPEGAERLYVSRTGYGARRGGVIGEVLIEERLAADGYDIFHPQKADFIEQIARYKAARQIVALDGSALHLLAMVVTPEQQIAMIRRRSSAVSNGIVLHLESFAGKPPLVIDAISNNWIRSDRKRVDRFSLGELDFPAIGAALHKAGMASDAPWPTLSPAARSEIFSDIERESGLTFNPSNAAEPEEESVEIAATTHGIEIPATAYTESPRLRSKIQKGRYEIHEIMGALEVVGPDDRVLECGSGLGVVGTIVAHHRRPKMIRSYEANPGLISVLEQTYAHNKVDDCISVTHGALMSEPDAPETVSFNVTRRFAASSLAAPKRGLVETIDAPVHRFEDVRGELSPTVLLMDIEGAELDFLEHADLTGIHSVVMEFHPDVYGEDGMARCKKILNEAGFEPLPECSIDTVWTARNAAAS